MVDGSRDACRAWQAVKEGPRMTRMGTNPNAGNEWFFLPAGEEPLLASPFLFVSIRAIRGPHSGEGQRGLAASSIWRRTSGARSVGIRWRDGGNLFLRNVSSAAEPMGRRNARHRRPKSVDLSCGVRHDCLTMKTATVRDLRNNFADVAKWIEHGEPVVITRKGTPFATLAPAKAAKPGKVDWAARLAKRKPLGRQLSAEETAAFWSRLRD